MRAAVLHAVQLAKLLGAGRIIVAGRGPGRLRRARELGADEWVPLDAADTGDRLAEAVGPGADLIIDLTWGAPAVSAMSAAATGARLVQVDSGAGDEAAVPAGIVRGKALAILGYRNFHPPRDERLDAYRQLADMATSERITVELKRVPLDDVALAWERQRTGARCKQILIPADDPSVHCDREEPKCQRVRRQSTRPRLDASTTPSTVAIWS